jgi:hypothetical protein
MARKFILNRLLYPINICGQTNLVRLNAIYDNDGGGVLGANPKYVLITKTKESDHDFLSVYLRNIMKNDGKIWPLWPQRFVGMTAHVCSKNASMEDARISFAIIPNPSDNSVRFYPFKSNGKISLPAGARVQFEITFQKSNARGV